MQSGESRTTMQGQSYLNHRRVAAKGNRLNKKLFNVLLFYFTDVVEKSVYVIFQPCLPKQPVLLAMALW